MRIKDQNTKSYSRAGVLLIVGILMVFIIAIGVYRSTAPTEVTTEKITDQGQRLYDEIRASAYDADEDFSFYVDKFYRDIELYGIYPVRPDTVIIKFADLDKMKATTHIHGISYGSNDDSRIEIYVNPSTWKDFKKPMRYFLMYHELCHDVLNLDDLEAVPANEGKLMYPAISSFEMKNMDDFIEASHALFEEVAMREATTNN